MKTKSILAALVALVALSACGPSAEQIALDRKNAATADDLARRQALDELRLARERARIAGRNLASDGVFTRRAQCESRLAAGKLAEQSGFRQFAAEMKGPFFEGCMLEANVNVRNQRLAAKKMRLAAKGANKK